MKSILTILALAIAVVLAPMTARAQSADPAAAQIQGFNDSLVAMMKSGGTAKARADKIRPALDKAFDLPGMTGKAVGTSWAAMAPADQKALTDAFSRMTAADYAKNFNSYDGEKFAVDANVQARNGEKFVKSTLTTGGTSVPFLYRLHQAGSDWKVLDIYLNGNISQMGEKRDEFASVLASGGPQALAKRLNALADQMLS